MKTTRPEGVIPSGLIVKALAAAAFNTDFLAG